jgi:hypothetical protein
MISSRYAWLLPAALLCGGASAQIDPLVGGVTAPSAFYGRYALNSGDIGNVAFIPDPAGTSRTVISTTVRSTDTAVGTLMRTDYYPLNEARATGVRWYGLSVYLPASWAVHPYPTVIAQIENIGATAPGLPSLLSLLVRGDNLELNINANYLDPAIASESNSASQVMMLGPAIKERWNCMVVRSDWQPTLGIGAVTMWINGEKVYNAAMTTSSYVGAAQRPSAGLLFPGLMGVPERTLVTDFISVGGPTTTVSQMYQNTPCAGYISGGNIQW